MQERGVIAWMACNPVAANLLMIVIMMGGLLGLNNITKEVFPTFPSETMPRKTWVLLSLNWCPMYRLKN
jgi:hypothetical protein